jgi:hypothetical protein
MQDRNQKIIIAVLAVLLVVVSAALVRQVFYAAKPAVPSPLASVPASNPLTNEAASQPAETNLNIPTAEPTGVSVNWLIAPAEEPAAIVSTKLGVNVPANVPDSGDLTYDRVGSIASGAYAGDDLYAVVVECGPVGENCGSDMAIALPGARGFLFLKKYMSNSDIGGLQAVSSVNNDLQIYDLTPPPETISLSNGYALARLALPTGIPDSKAHGAVLGQATDGTIIYNDADKPAVELKDNELVDYKLTVPFFADERTPDITWKDGTANDTDYSFMATGGCGSTLTPNVITDTKIASKIVSIGTTANGETIYGYSDTNAKPLKDLYSIWYVTSGAKPSYSKFLAMKPILIWKDPFGRYVQWSRNDIQPMAECGKPVVYLYPTQTEKVAVKLGSNITVEKSDPQYDNGWNVVAEPNGTLTTADGKKYQDLYWDGNGASYNTPTTGFVVARNDVEAAFKSKLSQLGLNAKEISDFNDFWLPIVTKSPYALISFVPQDEWSKAAPLSISPAPQTLIRVFMDWKPLAEPINVAPQTLPATPARTGFTAVEWGGLLYR